MKSGRLAILVDEQVGGRSVKLRQMRREDIDAFVAYWHTGIADLAHLGIDPAKLGTEPHTRLRFEQLVDGPMPRPAIGFTVTMDERSVGFININVFGRRRGTVKTRDLEDPDGLAGPGTFNIYEIGGHETDPSSSR